MNMMTDELDGFELRLLGELRSGIADGAFAKPATAHRRRRYVLAGLAAAAAVAAGITVPTLVGDGSSQAAYAVDTAADGTVSVTRYTRSNVDEHGNPIGVSFVNQGDGAPGALSIKLTPTQFTGHTLVLELGGTGPIGATSIVVLGLADGPVAPCVLVDAP